MKETEILRGLHKARAAIKHSGKKFATGLLPDVQVPQGPGLDRAGFLARNPGVAANYAASPSPGAAQPVVAPSATATPAADAAPTAVAPTREGLNPYREYAAAPAPIANMRTASTQAAPELAFADGMLPVKPVSPYSLKGLAAGAAGAYQSAVAGTSNLMEKALTPAPKPSAPVALPAVPAFDRSAAERTLAAGGGTWGNVGSAAPVAAAADSQAIVPRSDGVSFQTKAAMKQLGLSRGTAFVEGPGTGTSDSIHGVSLSKGEAVLPAKTVQAVGVGNLARLIHDTIDGIAPKGLRAGGHFATAALPVIEPDRLPPAKATPPVGAPYLEPTLQVPGGTPSPQGTTYPVSQEAQAMKNAAQTRLQTPTGAAPTGAAPTGAAPTGAAPTGAAPTGAAPSGLGAKTKYYGGKAMDKVADLLPEKGAAARGAAKLLTGAGAAVEGGMAARDMATDGMDSFDRAGRGVEAVNRVADGTLGAAAGAAMGSVVPLVGTAIGGIAGGYLGAKYGPEGIQKATNWLYDRNDVLPSEKAEALRAQSAAPVAAPAPAAPASATAPATPAVLNTQPQAAGVADQSAPQGMRAIQRYDIPGKSPLFTNLTGAAGAADNAALMGRGEVSAQNMTAANNLEAKGMRERAAEQRIGAREQEAAQAAQANSPRGLAMAQVQRQLAQGGQLTKAGMAFLQGLDTNDTSKYSSRMGLAESRYRHDNPSGDALLANNQARARLQYDMGLKNTEHTSEGSKFVDDYIKGAGASQGKNDKGEDAFNSTNAASLGKYISSQPQDVQTRNHGVIPLSLAAKVEPEAAKATLQRLENEHILNEMVNENAGKSLFGVGSKNGGRAQIKGVRQHDGLWTEATSNKMPIGQDIMSHKAVPFTDSTIVDFDDGAGGKISVPWREISKDRRRIAAFNALNGAK